MTIKVVKAAPHGSGLPACNAHAMDSGVSPPPVINVGLNSRTGIFYQYHKPLAFMVATLACMEMRLGGLGRRRVGFEDGV